MLADEERRSSEMLGWAEEHCNPSCERRMTVEEEEEEVGGSCDDGRIGTRGGGSSTRYYRSKSYSALQQSPLPMATTPPLSPELLERGEARCKADFSRSNTWDRITAAGLYAVSLWKLSQEMIEEKAKVLTEGPVGKLKGRTFVNLSDGANSDAAKSIDKPHLGFNNTASSAPPVPAGLMAGRWRSAQRRKRWTDHAVRLPEGTLHSLDPLPALQPFASQLDIFGRQPSIHAQLALVKSLGNSLLAVLHKFGQQEQEVVRVSLRVYVELLFVEHSRPLHRGFLSTLSRLSTRDVEPLRNAFMVCCREYGSGGAKRRRFAVVAVSASLASLPQPGVMKEVTQFCTSSVSNSLRLDVRSVLQHALDGGRPTPNDMEECQDALSSIYYLLQQFPEEFLHPISHGDDEEGFDCRSGGKGSMENVEVPENLYGRDSNKPYNAKNSESSEWNYEERMSATTGSAKWPSQECEEGTSCSQNGGGLFGAIVCGLLDVLQTAVLSRDCLVAAGVGLAAAAQLSSLSQEGLAFTLASAIFPSTHYSYTVVASDCGLTDARGEGEILETAISFHRKSSLRAEMDKLSDFGKLCFLRGLLTAIRRNAQNVHLLRSPNFRKSSGSEVALNQVGQDEPPRQVWTLLYDGILPALCSFCETSVDSHFKFHAFTAMQICLQQIKTSICGDLTFAAFQEFEESVVLHNFSVLPYDPLPVSRIGEVLKLIWNNWEDPLTQTVKQVQVVFDLIVDVRLVHKRNIYGKLSVENGNIISSDTTMSNNVDEVGTDNFLRQIACDLLAAGRYRKGKYVPLASLVLRIGARNMLLMSPDLLFQTVDAFSDDDVCSSASTFLKTFLQRLKEDCWSAEGVNEGIVVARRFWIPALLSGLLKGNPKLRNNLTTYALPVAMQIDSDSLPLILAYTLDGHGKADVTPGSSLSWEHLEGAPGLPGLVAVEQRVILLISVLKVARSLGLVEGSIEQKLRAAHEVDLKHEGEFEAGPSFNEVSLSVSHAELRIKDQPVEFSVSLFLLALTHQEDGLRVDAAELMCLNPKTASMPSPLELCLLRIALPLNMRCSSTAFRMRWISFLKKFFLRVRTAVERQLKAENLRASQLKRVETSPSGNGGEFSQNGDEFVGPSTSISKSAVTLEQMQEFMQWLTQMLLSSLYPSAPYERKNMAMEIFNSIIEVWSLKQFWGKSSDRDTSSTNLDTVEFSPYHNILFSVDCTLVVVGALVDSWDRLREAAYKILMRYPSPLPGLDSESTVEGLLTWAKGMVNSPRVRESDAGALAFRLIFRKYVLDLGWSVGVHPDPKVLIRSTGEVNSNFEHGLGGVTIQYLESLNDWLQWGIEEGEKDLLKACTHSFVHGVLLVLRYTVEEIDWTSSGMQLCSEQLRAALARLLSLLLRVTSLALWVVSADALNLQEKLDGSSLSIGVIPEKDSSELDLMGDSGAVDDTCFEECLAPAEQMVMVGCWLSVKEVSLLLGTMARVVPLPGSLDVSESGREENETPSTRLSSETTKSSPMLDGKQLEAIGSHFVQVLLSMKHNGAIDKTRTGFIALCDRLLRSSDPWLNKLPEVWLLQLMDHTGARGQVVDDLLRRSAGIPPAFLALFLAEPDGAPKKLLPMGMRWLLDTCNEFLVKSNCQNQKSPSELELSNQKQDLLEQEEPVPPVPGIAGDGFLEADGKAKALKSRDEGVVPTVHAFNVLRMAFHDTTLATDTSGFCAEGIITAIKAFSSSHWEVRNSATLAFTALIHRTVGFLNVFKRESARRAITGFEFFHRYPNLHPFLLQELQSATQQLEHGTRDGSNAGSGLGSLFHPSLGPILIILSRLKPSFINSDVEDWLNPSAFIPYVSQCATNRNSHMRSLASQALAPLVSAKDLSVLLLRLAQSLPLSASASGEELVRIQQKSLLNAPDSVSLRSNLTGVYQACSFNAIHGILLQICILLSSNCTSVPDLDLQSKIVTQVSEAVEERLWLGSIRLCGCYMVIGSFLDMLGGLLSLAQLCQERLSNSESLINHLQVRLCELSCECFDNPTQDLNFLDTTRVGLREKAASLYFHTMLTRGSFQSSYLMSDEEFEKKYKYTGTVFPGDTNGDSGRQVGGTEGSSLSYSQRFEEFRTRLKQALVDRSYEVRLATLKVLKKHYGLQWAEQDQSTRGLHHQMDKISRDCSFLRPLIVERLATETHSPCIRRILQVIYFWTLIDKVDNGTPATSQEGQRKMTVDNDSVWGSGLSPQELYRSLLKIYKTSKEMKTKEVAVRCLGGCVQHITVGIVDIIKSSSISQGAHFMSHNYTFMDGGTKAVPQFECSPNMMTTKDISGSKALVSIWLDIAKVHSAASEAVNFRRATAEAIIASGILKDAEWVGHKLMEDSQRDRFVGGSSSSSETRDLEWYARAILSAWYICIKFLEDEDLDLRQKLAFSILNVITKADLQANDVAPAQVEKVIQVSFEFLSSQFGQWREYYEILAEWVHGSEDNKSVMSGDSDLVRHLFDKEIDNHHEEELLFVQLCCQQLEKFLRAGEAELPSDAVHSKSSLNSSGYVDVHQFNSSVPMVDGKQCAKAMSVTSWYDQCLWKWRLTYVEQARLCARLSVNINDKMQWVGGVTNHADIFKSLYRSLQGLLTFGGCRRDRLGLDTEAGSPHEEEFLQSLAEVTDRLRQLPLNPIVSNTLVQVLQVYEQQMQVTLGSSELRAALKSAYSANFSPLFLIS